MALYLTVRMTMATIAQSIFLGTVVLCRRYSCGILQNVLEKTGIPLFSG